MCDGSTRRKVRSRRWDSCCDGSTGDCREYNSDLVLMTDDGESDAELVRRFQRGDNDALDELVRRHQDRLYRLATVWLYNEHQAADVVQEVFLRSMRGLSAFRFRSAPFTWLYRATRNVCHEFNRRRRTEPLEAEPGDTAPGIEQQVMRQDAARGVRALLDTLPERQRDVVLLRIFEELSVRDTARVMGCREGTVKALLHKATGRLRLDMEEDGA